MARNNSNNGFMGMAPETIAKYSREYMRLNPHNIPGVARKRRRIIRREFVFSTHQAQ